MRTPDEPNKQACLGKKGKLDKGTWILKGNNMNYTINEK